MDHQVSPEPEFSQSDDSLGGEEEEDEEEDDGEDLENGPSGSAAKSGTAVPKIFSFSMVNSYGTANIGLLPSDGNILKINSKCVLLI